MKRNLALPVAELADASEREILAAMAKVADGAKGSGYQIFAALFTLLVVPREEPRLEARFEEAYHHYKRAMPRWLVRSFLEARRASK